MYDRLSRSAEFSKQKYDAAVSSDWHNAAKIIQKVTKNSHQHEKMSCRL